MRKFLPLIILAILSVLPLIGLSTYMMHLLILVIMWSVIGMAWNLLGGYCGQVSFGHAAYFGVGAYTAGILYFKLGLSAWWGLPLNIIVDERLEMDEFPINLLANNMLNTIFRKAKLF